MTSATSIVSHVGLESDWTSSFAEVFKERTSEKAAKAMKNDETVASIFDFVDTRMRRIGWAGSQFRSPPKKEDLLSACDAILGYGIAVLEFHHTIKTWDGVLPIGEPEKLLHVDELSLMVSMMVNVDTSNPEEADDMVKQSDKLLKSYINVWRQLLSAVAKGTKDLSNGVAKRVTAEGNKVENDAKNRAKTARAQAKAEKRQLDQVRQKVTKDKVHPLAAFRASDVSHFATVEALNQDSEKKSGVLPYQISVAPQSLTAIVEEPSMVKGLAIFKAQYKISQQCKTGKRAQCPLRDNCHSRLQQELLSVAPSSVVPLNKLPSCAHAQHQIPNVFQQISTWGFTESMAWGGLESNSTATIRFQVRGEREITLFKVQPLIEFMSAKGYLKNIAENNPFSKAISTFLETLTVDDVQTLVEGGFEIWRCTV